jgi:aspartate 1-decarboxylase
MVNRQPLSLKVLAAYARDMGTGVVRIDHQSMDSLGITAGDTVEIIGKKEGTDARCYPLLPSDENQGITRIDPDVRKIIGISIDDTVTIRNLAPVPAERFERDEPAVEKTDAPEEYTAPAEVSDNTTPETADKTAASTSPKFILSGSCIDFEKERSKLMGFMTTLESAAHGKSNCKCYSDGKKALGWDFFLLEVDQNFVERLRDVYPDIDKREANTTEERFALWMNKQLKKMELDFHLKLSDVPQEKVAGFRLDPEHFRDKTDLDDLR